MPVATTIVTSPDASTSVHAQSSNSLSTGAIGGIVAGGAAALVIAAALLWCSIRKRVNQKNRIQSTLPYRITDYNSGDYAAGQETVKGLHSWPLTPAMYPVAHSQSTGDRSSIDPIESSVNGPGRPANSEAYAGPPIPELMAVRPTPERPHNSGLPTILRAGSQGVQ